MSVHKTYAKALFEAAKEVGNAKSDRQMEELETQLDQFSKVLTSSKEARVALMSPICSSKEKAAIVKALSDKMGFSPLTLKFLELIARKGRIALLSEILDSFAQVRFEAEGGTLGQVVSAEALAPADVEELSKAFTKKLGKKVAFRVSTDPELLAGVKVTVGGVTYDGTLRSQLQRLRDSFVQGVGIA